MSTKCTIGYDNQNFHLYEECFDRDKVYLELNDDCYEIIESFSSKTRRETTVAIDVSIWRKIVESWHSSHWGKNPDLDHKEPKIDTEYLDELLENSLRKRAKLEIRGEENEKK